MHFGPPAQVRPKGFAFISVAAVFLERVEMSADGYRTAAPDCGVWVHYRRRSAAAANRNECILADVVRRAVVLLRAFCCSGWEIAGAVVFAGVYLSAFTIFGELYIWLYRPFSSAVICNSMLLSLDSGRQFAL